MIINKSDYKLSRWSGGTTTELFIYPPESSYQERDFKIRISSATVDVEESIFTKLPDYNRVLMIISGELEINHQDKYSKILSQYDCDYFEGAWDTSAKGKVVDFNLMTSKSLKGELKYKNIPLNKEFSLEFTKNTSLVGLYLISGKLIDKNGKQEINPSELLIFDDYQETMQLQGLEESQIIIIIVE